MNKAMLPLLCCSVFSAVVPAAMAATGEAQFLGVVTNGTCDIHVEVDGKRTNIINFGTVAARGADVADSVAIPFMLTPDVASPACAILNTVNRVQATWSGGVFSSSTVTVDGVSAKYPVIKGQGRASEAFVVMIFNTVSDSSSYPGAIGPGGIGFTNSSGGSDFLLQRGFNYSAVFFPGTVPGDFQASAAWVISYE